MLSMLDVLPDDEHVSPRALRAAQPADVIGQLRGYLATLHESSHNVRAGGGVVQLLRSFLAGTRQS